MSVYPISESDVRRTASVSADGRYRYSLTREWHPERASRVGRLVTFVMLNPSTADAESDDPTIRRCAGFAQTFAFDGIRVVNLYAYRATRPANLWAAADPVGVRNDDVLVELGKHDGPLIAAWGAHAKPDRVAHVRSLPGWGRLLCLGVTKSGAPRHPLYVKADTPLRPWEDA